MVRVYRKKVLQNVTFKSNNFLSVTELMVKALLQGYNVKEIPVGLNKRQYGSSKIKLFGVIRDHFGLILRVILYKICRKEI